MMNALFYSNQIRSSSGSLPIFKPTKFAGHHMDSQQMNDNTHLNISLLVRSGRKWGKAKESDNSISIMPLLLTWILILLYSYLFFTSSLKFDSTSTSLAPGIHLILHAGTENFTFLIMDPQATCLIHGGGVTECEKHVMQTWTCWWWTLDFSLGLCFLLKVTQHPLFHDCWVASGEFRGAALGWSTLAKGVWWASGSISCRRKSNHYT